MKTCISFFVLPQISLASSTCCKCLVWTLHKKRENLQYTTKILNKYSHTHPKCSLYSAPPSLFSSLSFPFQLLYLILSSLASSVTINTIFYSLLKSPWKNGTESIWNSESFCRRIDLNKHEVLLCSNPYTGKGHSQKYPSRIWSITLSIQNSHGLFKSLSLFNKLVFVLIISYIYILCLTKLHIVHSQNM